MKNEKIPPTILRLGKAILALVLACALVPVWATASAYAADGHYAVSLGDSFSSGEGNEPFYGQNDLNKTGNYDWLAHRSEKSWPGALEVPTDVEGLTAKLSDNKGDHWKFVASSGAVISDLYGEQNKEFWQGFFGPNGTKSLPAQLDAFTGIEGKVDYVTITIGGNDLGFSDILSAAVMEIAPLRFGTLDAHLNTALSTFYSKTKAELEQAYGAIRDKAGDKAKIIIVGYPRLISMEGSRDFAFDKTEASKINESVMLFNEEIERIVVETNDPNMFFVDVAAGFSGNEAYTSDPYIHPLFFGPKSQELKQGLKGFVSSYSMHPNEKGLREYTKAVQAKIDEISKASSLAASTADAAISLVFDVSESMNESSAYGGKAKLESAQEQGRAFVRSIENQFGQSGLKPALGVVSFSNGSSVSRELTDDYSSVDSAIGMLSANNGTNIYAGLSEGLAQLEGATGTKAMILLSGGKDTAGNSDASILELAEQAAGKGIKIYTIGFGSSSDLNESLLERIASVTGGTYSHEDPLSVTSTSVGIFATMISAQLSATSQVLVDSVDTVAQSSASAVESFSVDTQGDIPAVLYWLGSKLELSRTQGDSSLVYPSSASTQ